MADLSEHCPDNDQNVQPEARLKKEYTKREAVRWIIFLAAVIIIALVLRFFIFEFIRIDGKSMQPVLDSEEYVFMEKVSYWFSAPQRGDIIFFLFPGSDDFHISRVIGLPGERIKVEGGVLYINETPNYDYFSGVHEDDMQELTVPENCVMVMGDNRNDSMDSRSLNVGPIPYDKIQGKADFIIWPFNKIDGL